MRSSPRPATLLAALLAALLGSTLLLAPTAAAQPPTPESDPTSGIDASLLPEGARAWLPLIGELTGTACPELPPVWVVAQVQAESGWDPLRHSEHGGGAAGLYQFDRDNWVAAGGTDWTSDPPAAGDQVSDPESHLRIAVPWICTTVRAVTRYLQATGRTADPLDAMLVCHIAGCGRVVGSATGVPVAGEAGCGERCAEIIRGYLDAVHADVAHYSAPAPAPPVAAAQPAEAAVPAPAGIEAFVAVPPAWDGGTTGCRLPDPTRDGGCLTGATAHGLSVSTSAFGGRPGPMIHTAGCWDQHAWNPRSDHPRGRACDLFPGDPGRFAEGEALAAGWRMADWFRANTERLQVRYLIWQGRYWAPDVADRDGGWGRRYTGAGVYDPSNATGGHFDHVHVSFRE